METPENSAVLEITSTKAKFLLGFALSGQPYVLYYAEKPIRGLIKDGKIVDEAKVAALISSFSHIEDEALKVKIDASQVALVLPPQGLQVFQDSKTSYVVDVSGVIGKIDVSNVMSLVKKEIVSGEAEIVDIVPDCFLLEGKGVYRYPPLGEKSNSITIQAKIHTLPKDIVYSYRKTAEKAGFRIKRKSVSPYLANQLLLSDKDMPDSCIYIDMGAGMTSISLIGKGALYGTVCFPKGGDELDSYLAASLKVDEDTARSLKENFGYDLRFTSFAPPIFVGADTEGNRIKIFSNQLNEAIKTYYEDYCGYLGGAITSLLSKQGNPDSLSNLPLVLCGGSSCINGLKDLLSPIQGSREIIHFVPKCIGGRDPGMVNLLGMLVAEGRYRGTLEDDYHGVATLSRGK